MIFRPFRRRWSTFLPLSVALILVFSLSLAAHALHQWGDGVVQLRKDIRPPIAQPGDEIEVTITLSADPNVCPPEVGEKPADVVLVLDHSPSMMDPAFQGANVSKLEKAKEAALTFVDEVNLSVNRVAVVQFAGTAQLLQSFTQDRMLLRQTIEGIGVEGATAIHQGLRVAREVLERDGRPNSNRVIVLLSDGRSDEGAAIREADLAKSQGIRIIAIGIGPDVNAHLMQSIATLRNGQPDVYLSPDAADLQQIYIDIAKSIREFTPVTNLEIVHFINTSYIRVLPNTISHNGILTGQTVQDRVIWRISALGDKSITLSYKAQVVSPIAGKAMVDKGERLRYIRCEKEEQSFTTAPSLSLQVQIPTPTPTITPTYTPTSPLPPGGVPQEGEGGQGVPVSVGTPTPTAEPGLLDRLHLPKPSQPAFCSSRYWWIPAFILPLLLILLLLLLIWRISTRSGISWYNLWQEWKTPCKIFSLIAFLYALIFAFLVGRELFVGLCKPPEVVYFWRMDLKTQDFGIYLTTLEERQSAVPFKQVNAEGCIGCHTVSRESFRIAAVVGPIPGRGIVYTLSGKKVDIPPIDAIYYAWSPDGNKLAFSDSVGDIYVLDMETKQITPLEGASEPQLTETMPAWSPDGSTIAFVRSSAPLDIGGSSLTGPADIYVVPASGGTPKPLPGASGNGMNYYPAYSPDGKWLAFTRHTTGSQSYAAPEAEIYLVPAQGGQPIRLEANDAADGTPLKNVSNAWPTWSKDGKWLAFNSKRKDPFYDIFVTRIETNGHSSEAIPLPGASDPGIFEHTPFWGAPLQPLPLWERLLNLWPWLIPLLLLLLLRWLLCRGTPPGPEPLTSLGRSPESKGPPPVILPYRPTPPPWDPAPTLVIGLGGTGRQVLTHLKKNLLDAGMGRWHERVQLLLIDVAPEEIVEGSKVTVEVTGVKLSPNEQVIVGEDLKGVIERMVKMLDTEPELRSWFPVEEYTRVWHLPDAEMDVRHSTNRRRPLGRAVVFRDIQKGAASRLWQRLIEALGVLAREQEVARVLIIGSLSGGFGSAIVPDIAYLVRKAAMLRGTRETTTVITAFMATDNAFAYHTRDRRLKLNTMATLRELSRFQMARARPFPMIYRQDTDEPHLKGHIEWSLLDEIFIFDGQRTNYPLTLYPPEQAMFPLMADIAQIFIDRGSQLIEEVRANTRVRASQEQLQTGEPVVSALGAYVYRLPLRDIVRTLSLRFARDLLVLLVSGADSESEETSLTSQTAQKYENYGQNILSMVDDFLRGNLYEQAIGVGGASELVAALARREPYELYVGKWRSLTAQEVNLHTTHYREMLMKMVLYLLNGAPDEAISEARSGKIGYVKQFLEQLLKTLEDAKDRCASIQPHLPDYLEASCRLLRQLIENEQRVTEEVYGQLMEVLTLLVGQHKASADPAVGGLIARLQERLEHEKKWRTELINIKTRRTFLDDKLLESLYEEHFKPYLISPGLESFYWRQDERGRLSLVLAFGEAQEDKESPNGAVVFHKEQAKEIEEVLTRFAESVSKDIWTLRLDPYFDDQDQGLWGVEKQCRQEADTAVRWSEPLVQVRVGTAGGRVPARYLWVNKTVASRQRFAKEVQSHAVMYNPVQILDATDPFSAAVLTFLDILPLSSLRCYERVEGEYRNAFHIGERVWHGDVHSLPEPLHVFAAERHALQYERRLGELHERPRLFHPLFVAALENIERARLFVLAYVLKWVRRERVQVAGEWLWRYVLQLPANEQTIPLTEGDNPRDPVALIVRAMQTFVLGRPGGISGIPIIPEQLAYVVKRELDTYTGDLQTALRNFYNEKPIDLQGEKRLGIEDFWAFARLLAKDEWLSMQSKGGTHG